MPNAGLAIAALVISGAAALAAAVALALGVAARRAAAQPSSKAMAKLLHQARKGDVQSLPALLHQIDLHLARVEQRVEAAENRLAMAVQKVGLVRFDAEPELGGKVSFALALLDQNDNGFILTSVYRLEDSRIFLREVRSGATQHELLPEERQALSMARECAPQGPPAGP